MINKNCFREVRKYVFSTNKRNGALFACFIYRVSYEGSLSFLSDILPCMFCVFDYYKYESTRKDRAVEAFQNVITIVITCTIAHFIALSKNDNNNRCSKNWIGYFGCYIWLLRGFIAISAQSLKLLYPQWRVWSIISWILSLWASDEYLEWLFSISNEDATELELSDMESGLNESHSTGIAVGTNGYQQNFGTSQFGLQNRNGN